ncbi:MAG: SDR family NAD(P)-dependent oxidoreductase [Myxococcaceae bacterium]|nr:SDR family NAD(P)-dependent oxidoreductase [Myxococcaceae bacterium]
MRTILITGATDGIGLATARALALPGVKLLIHGRDMSRAQAACTVIAEETAGVEVVPLVADFRELAQVRALAQSVRKSTDALDVLINCAGAYFTERQFTADGRELTMAVNHDAHVLLTLLTWPLLKRASGSRVINVTCAAYRLGKLNPSVTDADLSDVPASAYPRSKLAQVLFSQALARLQPGVSVHSVHPGVTDTKLLRASSTSTPGVPPADSTATLLYVVNGRVPGTVSGRHYEREAEVAVTEPAADASLADAWFAQSLKRVGEPKWP